MKRNFWPVFIGLILFAALLASFGQFGQAGAQPQAPQQFQPAPQAMVTPSAATTLTVQTLSRSGVIPTPITPDGANGNKFRNNGFTWMEVANDSGDAVTVSIDIQATVDGETVGSKDVSIADGAEKRIGPFPETDYNIDSATYKGYVTFLITPTTGITVHLFSLK